MNPEALVADIQRRDTREAEFSLKKDAATREVVLGAEGGVDDAVQLPRVHLSAFKGCQCSLQPEV